MSALTSMFRLFTAKQSVRKSHVALSCLSGQPIRIYSDKPDISSMHVVMSFSGTENEERVRVRRARPADVPGVLRFVREHAKSTWTGLVAPASNLVLCDYVARALAQGHSLLAEQQETRRGWSRIRGLALCMSVCPWDATMLERWARCIKCSRSRRLMHMTAHCLRAPALHEKYHVHNILQVMLIIPHNYPYTAEISQLLAKHAIQRGRDVGFEVLRFDVTDDAIAIVLEEMKLKKEWQLTYNVLTNTLKEVNNISDSPKNIDEPNDDTETQDENFVAVYTAMTTDKSAEASEAT